MPELPRDAELLLTENCGDDRGMTWMGIGGIMTALGGVIMSVSIVLITVTSFTPLPEIIKFAPVGILLGGAWAVGGIGIILIAHMIDIKRRVDNV